MWIARWAFSNARCIDRICRANCVFARMLRGDNGTRRDTLVRTFSNGLEAPVLAGVSSYAAPLILQSEAALFNPREWKLQDAPLGAISEHR
jgi:hypothetical protein